MKCVNYFMIFLFIAISANLILAQTQSTEFLPAPQISNGNDFLALLTKRKSCRNFASRDLTKQQLSEILWAAYGVADSVSGKRTVPSAHAVYEINVYIINKDGLFLYQPLSHSLKVIQKKDLRQFAGLQSFVAKAPLTLIYAADFSKLGGDLSDDKKIFLAAANTGFIAQNVYLYCASAGLGTVVRDWINRDLLSEKMGLSEKNQKIILGQTIGYPASE